MLRTWNDLLLLCRNNSRHDYNKIPWSICWCPKSLIGDKKFFYPLSPPETQLKKLISSQCKLQPVFCSFNKAATSPTIVLAKHFDQCLTIIMYLILQGYSSQVTLAICFLIFSVRNLLRSGAIKKAWEPVWFPVVEAFPPLLETKVNRKAEAGRMQKIIYPEDKFRK